MTNWSLSGRLTQGRKPSLPKGGGTVADGGRILWVYANAQISTAFCVSLSHLRFARCQLPLGKGAFVLGAN